MIERELCCKESRSTLNDVKTFREELVAFVETGTTKEFIIALDEPTASRLISFMERAACLLHRINRLLSKSATLTAASQDMNATSAWELKMQRDWLSELLKQIDNMIAA